MPYIAVGIKETKKREACILDRKGKTVFFRKKAGIKQICLKELNQQKNKKQLTEIVTNFIDYRRNSGFLSAFH